jgi:hypothetical protein
VTTSDKSKISERIRKLLALSRSDNPNEAAAAMAAAVKLADEHRLSMAQVEMQDPDDGKPVIVDVAKKPARWKQLLGSVLAEANHCVACFAEEGAVLVFVGALDDIATARAMYQHCTSLLVRLSHRMPSYSRRGFLFGAACGVQHQVEAAREQTRTVYAGTSALAVVDQRAERVRDMLAEKNVPDQDIKAGSSGSGFYAGWQTGARIALARGHLR